MKTILTSNHMAKFIDECIVDLETGGMKLYDLSQLLHCIGGATNNNVYDAIVPIVGGFGNEILSFRPFVLFPLLPEPTRKKFQQIFKEGINNGKKALTILKTEICERDNPDPAQILKALSILGRTDYNLTMARASIMKTSTQPKSEA